MRGADIQQDTPFSTVIPEVSVPKDHHLRLIREMVNVALKELDVDFKPCTRIWAGTRSHLRNCSGHNLRKYWRRRRSRRRSTFFICKSPQIAHAELSLQLQHRDAVFRLTDQEHRPKQGAQR